MAILPLRHVLNRPAALLGLQVAAFWPVWRWYVLRLTAPGDEPWGLVPLAIALLWAARSSWLLAPFADEATAAAALTRAALPTLLYAVAFPSLPPLGRALLAVAALTATLAPLADGGRTALSLSSLLFLSLPIVPSAQFFLGYPLRALVAALAVPMLRLAGYAVVREGTCLSWEGRLVSVDAPCSGVAMLWVGLVLAATLALLAHLNARRTVAAGAAAVGLVVAGNALRTSSLFIVESGLVKGLPWLHEAVGLAVFAATALAIALAVEGLSPHESEEGGEPCAPPSSC